MLTQSQGEWSTIFVHVLRAHPYTCLGIECRDGGRDACSSTRRYRQKARGFTEDASSLPGLHPEQHEHPVSLKEALKGHLLPHLSCRLDLPCELLCFHD